MKHERVQSSVEGVSIEEETKLRVIFASSPDAITVSDLNGIITECNQATLDALGFSSKNEIIGRSAFEFISKEDRKKAMENLKKTVEQGSVRNVEYTCLTKDGREFPAELSASVIKDSSGNLTGFVAITKDITERKKAEEELIRLSSAVKMSTDSIVISDIDAKIIDVNEATLKMYDTDDKRDLIGKNSFDLIAPEDREKALAGMKEVLEKGYVKNREYHIITKDGGRIPVEMSAAVMKDADGKPIGFVGISRDIRERKRAEEALRESEGKFRDIFEGVNDEILYIDKYGKIVDVNERVEDIFGYKRDEVIGKNFARLGALQPKELPIILKQFMDAMRGGVVKPLMEYEIKDKKGNKVPVEASTRLIKKDGKIEGLLVIVRDITERKKMEEKLKQYSEHLEELVQKRTDELLESEKRYSVLVEEASDGVVIVQDGKILFTNKRASEISRYSRDELIGLSLEKLVDERYRQLVKERYMRRMRGETVSATYEVEFIAKTGKRVPVEASATHIHYQGRPADLVVVRDIRERKRMEEERLKLEKLATIGELATMVGHDLRNPLQAITNAVYVFKNMTMTMNSTLMSEQYKKIYKNLLPDPIFNEILQRVTNFLEGHNKMIYAIDESVKYADKIVSGLQDFARTKEPERIEVDLESLIQETLSDISIPENVKASIRHDQALSKLYVDPNQIRRVLTNLTTNAIDAMPNGGKLTISTSLKNGFASIAFRDTGVGIPKENMKKLFIPLFTTKAKGMGMGLSICKRLVEIHGGTIEVESKEGKGSTFTVKLPIQQENGGENQ